MKILLLGNGGREHALAWKIRDSDHCDKLFIAPGNAGTAACGENVDLDPADFDAVEDFVIRRDVYMVVVGPEAPLVAGLYDHFLSSPDVAPIPVIGPVRAAARLEGSKAYAKTFMQKYDIPTAAHRTFERHALQEALAYLDTVKPPYVLKADGLAGGKGVLICKDKNTARQELKQMLSGDKFGDAGQKVVIEQFLDGTELSVFVLTDGYSYKLLPTSKDYKRVGEGDTGLNTGGMGAISPVPFADTLMERIEKRIIQPTLDGIEEEGAPYKGFLYFGLMNVDGDPYVIEYNCRLGDPEAQVVLPRIKTDLLDLFEGVWKGRLQDKTLETDPRAAATVVLASGGYPQQYEKGKAITGLDKIADCLVFHAGTRADDGKLFTNGGRILAVTALADTLQAALDQAYRNIEHIRFDKKYYRSDIGFDVKKS